MANDLTPYEPGADDGFSGSLNSGRLLKGTFLKWSDAATGSIAMASLRLRLCW